MCEIYTRIGVNFLLRAKLCKKSQSKNLSKKIRKVDFLIFFRFPATSWVPYSHSCAPSENKSWQEREILQNLSLTSEERSLNVKRERGVENGGRRTRWTRSHLHSASRVSVLLRRERPIGRREVVAHNSPAEAA